MWNKTYFIIITKSLYTKEIVEKNYKISYQFNDLKRYYVLTINDSIELKNIMLKEYKNWKLKEILVFFINGNRLF